ncbi:MAG: 30S ribosomal protein S6 [Phycisphaerae bacterium]|nr:30S ribosomal protein S6 [Phycisphaerae bacterium]
METVTKKTYEAMFLVDSVLAGSDWDGVMEAINKILDRAEAEVINIRKWDERRLAYPVEKKTRGTYILCYFRAGGEKVSKIERDVQLSEMIMRVLILNAEHFSDEDMDKDTPAIAAEKAVAEAAERRAVAEAEKKATEEAEAEKKAAEEAEAAVEAIVDVVEEAAETEVEPDASVVEEEVAEEVIEEDDQEEKE